MFSIMLFFLFGVLKIKKIQIMMIDVIRIFFALAQASFLHFWRGLRGPGLVRAPRGAPRRVLMC